VRAVALDAAQPFDMEAIQRTRMEKEKKKEKQLSIGIVGFGSFGQFLAQRMVKAGHRVLATSRSPYDDVAKRIGAEYYRSVDDFCEEHPEVVILCTSILSTESVVSSLPLLRLKRNTLFVDVLSVKVFPKQLLLEKLPPEVDILCTHPMFGPTSGAGSWSGLNFMYEKVRIRDEPGRQQRVDKFLDFFSSEGCKMVEMSCEEHDQAAASTQFITHTVGRMLGTMNLKGTKIDTKGFEALLNLVNNTANDSFELYYGLFLYNQNATEELERLELGLEKVKKGLFSKLHDIARAEMFPRAMLESQEAADEASASANREAPK
jgi:arogenate dehydrogenase (NADP+)